MNDMPTPRVDVAKCRMNICMTHVELDGVPADFARTLEREIADLARWKAEALAVEASWDCQAVGKALGLTLGSSIRPAILPAIQKMLANTTADCAEIVKLRTALNRIAHPNTYGTQDVDPRVIARSALLMGFTQAKSG